MFFYATFRLFPTKKQEKVLDEMLSVYYIEVNHLLEEFIRLGKVVKKTSRDIKAPLPSSCRTMVFVDARELFHVYDNLKENIKDSESEKSPTIPFLKHPVVRWYDETYYFAYYDDTKFSLPAWENGAYNRLEIKAGIDQALREKLKKSTLFSCALTKKKNKFLIHVGYTVKDSIPVSVEKPNVMGIDLNMRCPAVCVTQDNKVRFFGNGRQNKYMRRHFFEKRKALVKAGKKQELADLADKESRYFRDQDHQISRQIIAFALENNVSEIHLEKLTGIRSNAVLVTKASRRRMNSEWSFYRLGKYIAYKAKQAGIRVSYVSPAYTSQRCPKCNHITKEIKGNMFTCSVCGYHVQKDMMAAINIRDGKPLAESNK